MIILEVKKEKRKLKENGPYSYLDEINEKGKSEMK